MTEYLLALQEALSLHDTQTATAEALGVTRSRVSQLAQQLLPEQPPGTGLGVSGTARARTRKTKTKHPPALDVVGCLRLIVLTRHLDPAAVLRDAGPHQAEAAQLLERIYGIVGKERLTAFERQLHEKLKKLRPDRRRLVLAMISTLEQAEDVERAKAAGVRPSAKRGASENDRRATQKPRRGQRRV